jgi:hypothetical protein
MKLAQARTDMPCFCQSQSEVAMWAMIGTSPVRASSSSTGKPLAAGETMEIFAPAAAPAL